MVACAHWHCPAASADDRRKLTAESHSHVNEQNLPSNYKWLVLGITTIGVFMFAIDTTVVILALPDIMLELHSNLVNMVWVLMSYIFISTVLLLALGRIADIYGRVKLYNLGFIIFTLGSAFCGFSQNDLQLIGSRVFQGIGGALLLVNSLAIITEVFPPNQRGTAMGFNSMTFGTGSIVGPILGGVILAITSWRWIFLINVPIGIIATILAFRYLHEISPRRTGEKLDLAGSLSFSFSLFGLLFALTQSIEFGWDSPMILLALAIFVVGLVFFLFWERRSKCPALDLSLFQSQLFDFSVLAAMFQALAIFAVQFLVVFYLQAVRGNSPLEAALLLLPMPVVQAIAAPFSGRLSDRIGARVPATLGLLIQAFGMFWLSTLTVDSSYLHIATGLTLTGLGGGMFWSPNTSAAMGAAPPDRLGVGSATLATLRNTGMVTSFAIALAVAAGSLPRDLMLKLFIGTSAHLGTDLMAAFVDGMDTALRASVFIALIAATLSWIRGQETRGHKQASPPRNHHLGRKTMATRQTAYGFGQETKLPYEEAVAKTMAALKEEGFGVLTEIDVRKTLKEKLNADFRPYIILGACNPSLAHKALSAELDLGLLLPCNVVVYGTDGGSVIEAMDPEPVLALVGNPQLIPVAQEVKARLQRVIEKVAGSPG